MKCTHKHFILIIQRSSCLINTHMAQSSHLQTFHFDVKPMQTHSSDHLGHIIVTEDIVQQSQKHVLRSS